MLKKIGPFVLIAVMTVGWLGLTPRAARAEEQTVKNCKVEYCSTASSGFKSSEASLRAIAMGGLAGEFAESGKR